MTNKKTIVKNIKAAIPFLAAFGGNGFASQRAHSVSLSSRKFAKKPVVFVDNSEQKPPQLSSIKTKSIKNPFAAFTNKALNKTKTAEIALKDKTLAFLKSNKLLTENAKSISNISGNINSQKSFSDPWNFSTKLSGTMQGTTTCTNPSLNYFSFFQVSANSASCFLFNSTSNTISILNGQISTIESQCQAMHMQCDQQPLPVELEKFEIE